MELIITLTGVLGALLLAVCGLPQAIQSFKTGTSNGVNGTFLWLWGVGEILLVIYILVTTKDLILLMNYLLNIIIIGIIAYYKIKDSRKD
jgi:uncharacterized protein with PQ loop repeat